jgi:ABC-type transporter Mla MlaB component
MTCTNTQNGTLIKLEGALTREVDREVSRALGEVRLDRSCVVDLSGLVGADETGFALLHALLQRGARLEGGSAYIRAMLQEHRK